MKHHWIVTTTLVLNIFLSLILIYVLWVVQGNDQSSFGIEPWNRLPVFWVSSMGFFAILGILRKGWAVILSALFAISYFAFLVLIGIYHPPIKDPTFIITLGIVSLPIVLNVLTIIFYRKYNINSSG